MAKEPDQTRWRGIRPTDPSEDIPITLDAEVVHVIVDSGGGGFAAGAPIIISYRHATSAVNVWYTVANIVGAGHVQKIHLGAGVFFNFVEFRITVDGGVAVTYTPDANEIHMYQDLDQASHYMKEVPLYLIRYATSFKLEMRQTSINLRELLGLVTYIPDP